VEPPLDLEKLAELVEELARAWPVKYIPEAPLRVMRLSPQVLDPELGRGVARRCRSRCWGTAAAGSGADSCLRTRAACRHGDGQRERLGLQSQRRVESTWTSSAQPPVCLAAVV
jgi:hypothetical protein